MYFIDIEKKVYKFIETFDNSIDIKIKLKRLENFKSKKSLYLDIERIKGEKKKVEVYRLRIGEIKFIFQILKEKKVIWIKSANYRGKIYK